MSLLVHSWGARLRAFGRDRRAWGVAAVLLVAVALFLLPHSVSAVLPGESYLAGAFAWILGLIVSFLGKIISVLVYVLMGFLQYNGFADAQPVVMGWVIVRDFVNMLFIVVLLISAVATILNYDTHDLHVKNVLPNLIAAAILINFSKMIVGLLVDASQVVTLTFVNAFQASGIGNFAQVLGLPSFTTLTTQTPTQSASSASPTEAANGQIIFDVLLAYMLAMFMLVISIGVISIMILFTVGRIVGLWVLLIVSPAAMFASCMPKKLQKMFGSLEHEFWEKLTGLCTGGPIMAFFLWLSFATVRSGQQGAGQPGIATRLGLFRADQGGLNQDGIIGSSLGNATAGTADFFLSRIGNADGIASFIVGVALMMIGLDQAVKASGAAGDLVKGYADQIKKQSKSTASWLASRPVATPWNAFDRRVKLTDKVASGINSIPLVDTMTSGKLRDLATYRKDELKKQSGKDVEYYDKLTGWQKKWRRGATEFAASTPIYGTDADRMSAVKMGQGAVDGYKKKKRALGAEYENELMNNPPTDTITGAKLDPKNPAHEEEIKNQAKAHAAGGADQSRRDGFKVALENAKKLEDWESVTKLEEQADANPALWKDIDRARFGRGIKKMSDEEFEKNDELTSDGDALMTRAQQADAIDVDKTTREIKSVNNANFDHMVATMPKAAKRIRAMQAMIAGNQATPGVGGVSTAATDKIRSTSFMQDAAKMTSRVYDGSSGKRVYSPTEEATRKGLNSTISSGPGAPGSAAGVIGHGRDAAGVLSGGAAAQVETAFNHMNINIKELETIDAANGGSTTDKAVVNRIAANAQGELTAWADINSAMSTIAKAGEQMADLDEKSQTVILKAINDSTRVGTMSHELKSMSAYQQEQFLNVARRAKELARSTDVAVKAEAEKFLKDIKDHMPRTRTNITNKAINAGTPGGPPATIDTQATPAFSAVLYSK